MLETGRGAEAFISEDDVAGVEADALEGLCREVIEQNAKMAAAYRAGKEKAMQALLGQVMRVSKGRANATEAEALLKQYLQTN
jgi:aspartyl-tRNA(Asn)/glutamyl-tRNA(Gln) amidotransferase subunit B